MSKIIEKMKFYFKTGFFHIFGANILNKVIGFFSGVIIVRVISKTEYGLYSYALNVVQTFEIFSAMGMVAGVFQMCSEKINDKEDKNKIYRYGSAYGFYFNTVLSLILWISTYIIKYPIEYANEMLRFAFLYPALSVIVEFQNIRLRSDFKTKEYSYANVLGAFLISTFTVVGGVVARGRGALLLRSIAFLAAFLIVRIFTNVGISLTLPKLDRKEKKDLFSISLVSMINNGLSQLLLLVDIYVVGFVLTDTEAVALYKVATTIPMALTFVPASLVVYIYPYFASHKDEMNWIWANFKKYSVALGVFNGIIVSILFVFSDFIIIVVFGKEYIDAVASFRILLFNYLITSSFKLLIGNIMVMLRRLKYNLFETILSSVLNIIADYFLIMRYSIEGAAIATIVITIIISSISLTYLYVIYRRERIE